MLSELIAALLSPPRLAAVRFATYRPDSGEPSQEAALRALTGPVADFRAPRLFIGRGVRRLRRLLRNVYAEEYRKLYEQIYAGDTAVTALNDIVDVLLATDGVDRTAVESEAASPRSTVQARTESLADNVLITG